ncbi:hypothetical protein E5Q_03649 [Mixia osmundae IAM 14324]|uniref:Uncharacterized protein n=1 Tax=Mixia osmundae (strain CBS 9802 / IAM 14324 / JCM 22182 / KY 12970) TaxID=764103 RepID=G7E2B5_MIXOS|nr:hypothetical protein E5Q_03649 [Mixia osmundae IAM 14324]
MPTTAIFLKLLIFLTAIAPCMAIPPLFPDTIDLTVGLTLTCGIMKPRASIHKGARVRLLITPSFDVELLDSAAGDTLYEDGPREYIMEKVYMDYVLLSDVQVTTQSWLSEDIKNCCKITAFFWLIFEYTTEAGYCRAQARYLQAILTCLLQWMSNSMRKRPQRLMPATNSAGQQMAFRAAVSPCPTISSQIWHRSSNLSTHDESECDDFALELSLLPSSYQHIYQMLAFAYTLFVASVAGIALSSAPDNRGDLSFTVDANVMFQTCAYPLAAGGSADQKLAKAISVTISLSGNPIEPTPVGNLDTSTGGQAGIIVAVMSYANEIDPYYQVGIQFDVDTVSNLDGRMTDTAANLHLSGLLCQRDVVKLIASISLRQQRYMSFQAP